MRVGGVLLAGAISAAACGSAPATMSPACETADASSPAPAFDAGEPIITVNVLLVDTTAVSRERADDPLWVGYQAADSTWQPAMRAAPGRFRFPASSDGYQFAVICGETGLDPWSELNLVHATVSEAQELTVLCASRAGAAPPTFSVYVRESVLAKLWMGRLNSGLPTEASTGLTWGAVFPTVTGSSDLIVGRSRYASGYQPWEFLLLRGLFTPPGGSYFVDFGLEPWRTVETHSTAVEGFDLDSGSEHLNVDFITSGGTWLDLTTWTYFDGLTDVSNGVPFVTLPTAGTEPGDLHCVWASKERGRTTRIVRRYDRVVPSDATLRLPPAISDVKVSVATSTDCASRSSVMVPEVSWAPGSDLQFFSWFHRFNGRRVAFVVASAGWLGGRSSYAIAKPSGAQDWDPAWLPPADAAQEWQFSAVRSDVSLADAIHLLEARLLTTQLPPLEHAEMFISIVDGP